IELGEDVAQVPLHCFLTKHQRTGDVVIAATLGHQPQHFDLALGEPAWSRSSEKPIDLLRCRRSAYLSKDTSRNTKLSSCRVLITKFAQRTSDEHPSPGRLIWRPDVTPKSC